MRTRIRRIPIVGPALRSAYYGGRQQIKYARGAALQAARELRKRRERSARSVTKRNNRRAYERLYSSPNLLADYLQPSRIQFYQDVADICSEFEPRSVVDVGCGTGHLLAEVLARTDAVETAVGIDYAGSAIQRARELIPSARWLIGDVYALDISLDSSFDLVLCTEVLEHLARPVEALEGLAHLRARGGRLVLTVPDGTLDSWKGHVNFWGEHEFRRLLEPFGEVNVRRIESGRTLLATVAGN